MLQITTEQTIVATIAYVPGVSIDLQDRAIEEANYNRYPFSLLRGGRSVFFGKSMLAIHSGYRVDDWRDGFGAWCGVESVDEDECEGLDQSFEDWLDSLNGEFDEPLWDDRADYDYEDWRDNRCDRCNGTGELARRGDDDVACPVCGDDNEVVY